MDETDDDILQDRRRDLVLVLLLQVQGLVQQLDQRGHVVEEDSSGTAKEKRIVIRFDHIFKKKLYVTVVIV